MDGFAKITHKVGPHELTKSLKALLKTAKIDLLVLHMKRWNFSAQR